MREIKFRAWHKGYPLSKVGGAEIPAGMMYPYPDRQSHVLKWLEEGQPVEIMQYTGLKDKNGVEIYEGDVIRHKNGLCDGIVRYWEGAFIAGTASVNSALANYNAPKMIEVIGNIHQNPELLEDSCKTATDV